MHPTRGNQKANSSNVEAVFDENERFETSQPNHEDGRMSRRSSLVFILGSGLLCWAGIYLFWQTL